MWIIHRRSATTAQRKAILKPAVPSEGRGDATMDKATKVEPKEDIPTKKLELGRGEWEKVHTQ